MTSKRIPLARGHARGCRRMAEILHPARCRAHVSVCGLATDVSWSPYRRGPDSGRQDAEVSLRTKTPRRACRAPVSRAVAGTFLYHDRASALRVGEYSTR